MRYYVKAKLKKGRGEQLKESIESGTLGKGSVAGGEYIRNMKNARLIENNFAVWIEVCFCDIPLAEEKPYWEEYFDLIQITDSAIRKACKHETGRDFWSCIDCNCTDKKEKELNKQGSSFLNSLSKTLSSSLISKTINQ